MLLLNLYKSIVFPLISIAIHSLLLVIHSLVEEHWGMTLTRSTVYSVEVNDAKMFPDLLNIYWCLKV